MIGDSTARDGMSLTFEERRALVRHLGDVLDKPGAGCDGVLTLTMEWAVAGGLDPVLVRRAVQRAGSFCDCDVLMNGVAS